MSDQTLKQYVFKRCAARRIPVSGTFELTPRCNFRCKMCYICMSGEEQCQAGRELTTEQWLGLAKEAVDAGMVYLLLTGGEPLLRPDFQELYTALIQMGLVIAVNTNASLITPQIVECFRKHPPEVVNVTLYGASEDTYSALCGNRAGYAATLRGVRMLREAGIRVIFNTTFTTYNRQDMESIVAFAKEEKIPVRTAAYLFPPVRNGHESNDSYLSPEEMGSLGARFDWLTLQENQKESRAKLIRDCLAKQPVPEAELETVAASCMAGRGAFWISWDGKLYPCGMLSQRQQDVLELGFREAWKKTVSESKTIRVPPKCMGCNLRYLCPTCAAVSETAPQEIDGVVKALCERTRAYAQTFLKEAEAGSDET